MCRAAADNAYGVIRPTVSTAPTSASARPAPSIKPWRRANNRIAVIRRLCRAGPCPDFGQRAPAGDKSASIAGGKARSVIFRNRLPTNPWDAAKPLIHGLPEAFITSSPTDLSTILQESERAASAHENWHSPCIGADNEDFGASVQAGWGIPSLHPAADAASARNRHTRFGDLGTGRLRTPSFMPGGSAAIRASALPFGDLGTGRLRIPLLFPAVALLQFDDQAPALAVLRPLPAPLQGSRPGSTAAPFPPRGRASATAGPAIARRPAAPRPGRRCATSGHPPPVPP